MRPSTSAKSVAVKNFWTRWTVSSRWPLRPACPMCCSAPTSSCNSEILSGQLSRRSLDVHFARYRADCKEDLQAFKSVLRFFQTRLPLKEEPDLVSMWEFLYEQSVGCVGILKGLINRGLAVALDEDSATLTAKHLERHALSLSRCEQIYREICENESRIYRASRKTKSLPVGHRSQRQRSRKGRATGVFGKKAVWQGGQEKPDTRSGGEGRKWRVRISGFLSPGTAK